MSCLQSILKLQEKGKVHMIHSPEDATNFVLYVRKSFVGWGCKNEAKVKHRKVIKEKSEWNEKGLTE